MEHSDPVQFGKTFESAFNEWVALREKENPGQVADLTLVKMFSDWLDRTKFLTPQIALLGMVEARKVDQEVMQSLVEAVGIDRAKEIVKPIVARYQRNGTA